MQHLFELTPAESIFAHFEDPAIATQLPLRVIPGEALEVKLTDFWDRRSLTWENCASGKVAARLELPLGEIDARFDNFVFCQVLTVGMTVQFEARREGAWTALGPPVAGNDHRLEVTVPMGRRPIQAVAAVFTATQTGRGVVALRWWGVAQSGLVAELKKTRPAYDGQWAGLILPVEQWPAVRFSRGLLFSQTDLPALRAKRSAPHWDLHYRSMQAAAAAAMKRRPEDYAGDYLPSADERYIREREHGHEPLFHDALVLGLVGLIDDNKGQAFHALRYVMSILHTRSWAISAECRGRGSVWDQGAFWEEFSVTACSLLLDWFDFALTPRARALARQVLWDKGVAVIEQDMLRREEVFRINQGPWFCRARILGCLYLETHWPRVRPHVESALADLREGLQNYIEPDGGASEGMAYFCVTLHTALGGLLAYARARGREVRELLPENIRKSGKFIGVMSAVEPGRVLMDGDNLRDRYVSDAIPMLAAIFPDEAYADIAATCLAAPGDDPRRFEYGIFSFIAGPAVIRPPRPVVPTFGRLPSTGHITSLRRNAAGRSLRLHLVGAKARPSHTHNDKSGLLLELDREPVFIDRGQIKYDDPRCETLKRSELHNVITPVLPGEIFPNQTYMGEIDTPVIPEGEGDETKFRTRIDLSPVWRGIMTRCTRELVATEFAEFSVVDAGEMVAPGTLSFHLQTRGRWELKPSSQEALLHLPGWVVVLHAPWAEEITQAEDLIDYRYQPVWHLQCRVAIQREFRLKTLVCCHPA